MAKQTIEVVVQDKTARALGQINNRVNGLAKSFGGVSAAAKGFVAILGAREIIQFGARIKDTTAEFQNYRNQLKLITDGQEDLNRVFNKLTLTAKENRTSFGETVDLFTKLRISTEALGIAEERVIDVTSKLSRALQVAGADGNTAASVIRQFGQAMASGEVRGDEFRSLVEGLGPALAIMARESGITVGQLRKMSQAGELTAETMFELLENSKSLTAAFESMAPTIDQLETELSDAFDRALVKLGEVTGATSLYEDIVRSLTRTFDKFAEVEGALVNIPLPELLKQIEDGTISAAKGIEELENRIKDAYKEAQGIGPVVSIPGMRAAKELREQLEPLIEKYKELDKTQKEQAEAAKKLAEEEQKRIDSLNAILKPYQEFINLGDKFIKKDYSTPLEKANVQYERAKLALEKLTEAQAKLNASDDNKDNFKDLSQQIEATAKAVAHFEKELNDLSKSPYTKFMEDLMESTKTSLELTEFTAKATQELNAQYKSGAIDLETYETAMRLLNGEQKKGKERTSELSKEIDKLNEKYSFFLQNGEELAKAASQKDLELYKEALDLKIISEQEFADAKKAINENLSEQLITLEEENQRRLDDLYMKGIQRRLEQSQGALAQEISNKDKEFLQRKGQEERTAEIVRNRIEFEKKSEMEKVQFGLEQANTMFTGLARVNKKFFAAQKAIAIAQAIINTYQGATKALATYPPPFNFIAAAGVVASGLAQVATIRAQTYQRGGSPVTGQPAVVGEDGPELIVPKQPSTVIPNEVTRAIEGMGGKGQVSVNFNITTTDARGFDELLVERRGTIVGIINQAMNQRGKSGVTV